MSSNIRITRWSSTEEVVDAVREFKDALSDPNASDKTKQEAREILDRLGGDGADSDPDDRAKRTGGVVGGSKSGHGSLSAQEEAKARGLGRLGDIP